MLSARVLIKLVFATVVILALVSLVVVPAPLKPLFFDTHLPSQYYKLAANAREFGHYTLYAGAGKLPKRNLLVWFSGGGFLYSDRKTSYGLLNELSAKLPDFDVLVFDYPVRFSHTVRESLLAVNGVLAEAAVGAYANYYAGGMSAGVMLMGTFQAKETTPTVADRIEVPATGIKFKAMVGVCGLYRSSFDNRLLNAMFQFYIMRGTPAPELYGCYGLTGTPKLVISATTEYLYAQTYRFVTLEPCESKVYANDLLKHSFPLLNNCPEARDTVERIAAFVTEHSRT